MRFGLGVLTRNQPLLMRAPMVGRDRSREPALALGGVGGIGQELQLAVTTWCMRAERHDSASWPPPLSVQRSSPDGTWFGLGDTIRRGDALVYRVAPVTVFGSQKATFGQTRWRF